jgi:hypothetical protein
MSTIEIKKPSRQLTSAFWTIIAVTTFFSAFVLPFYFPLREPVFSAAYTTGENNRAAAIAVAAISIFVTFVLRQCTMFGYVKGRTYSETEQSSLSNKSLWWALIAMVVCTTLFGFLIVHHGTYYADEGWFLVQLRTGVDYHRTIYTGFHFPYGPVLYFWPATFIRALSSIGVSMDAAYLASVVAMEALGVSLLFYTVKALPMRKSLKAGAFALITFCSFDTLLGINYAVLRSVLPFATMVLLTKQKNLWRAMVIACLGEVLQLAVSPELGIAFGGAVVIYSFYCAFTSGLKWLGVSLTMIFGGGIFAILIGPAYFLAFREFAKGGYSIILEPQPFVLVLLAAIVALAPLAVVSGFRRDHDIEHAKVKLLIGIYIITLGMLPAALSRCDAIHAFVNGIGAYLLAFVAIDQMTVTRQRVWIVLVTLTFAATQLQEVHAFYYNITRAIQDSPEPYDSSDVAAVSKAIGKNTVTFPWNAPPLLMIRSLSMTGQYQPGYYCGALGGFDETSEKRRIHDMRAAKFALVPNDQVLVFEDKIDNHGVKLLLRFGFKYRARRTPFFEYAMVKQELITNWAPRGVFGMYTLYERVR